MTLSDKNKKVLLVISLVLCAVVAFGESTVNVTDMRCEYLSAPLGIDVTRPRLSWKLSAVDPAAHDLKQAAYQISVASRSDLLAADRPDLWDSGMISSDQSVNIAYDGKPLKSGMKCFWKVRVKDGTGITSPWSNPEAWAMGLLDNSDWRAKWIHAGSAEVDRKKQPTDHLPDPWLRKKFNLKTKPERATIYLASIGYHELYVNGTRVGDSVLMPSVTNHRKRARYVTYEVADLLKPGANVIAIWLGTGWSTYPAYKKNDRPQVPIVIAQAEMKMSGADTVRIVTDDTWRTHESPNTLIGAWNFMNYGGERYDARREIRGWAETDFDDSQWKPAQVCAPDLIISAEIIEPNRRLSEIQPVSIEETGPGVYRVDLGVNVTGFFEADVRGLSGDQIDFKFSEHPDEEITHQLRSEYVIGPSGKGTFRNRFNYFTGRWITIKGLKYKPALDDMRASFVRTDYERSAGFKCSNELLNRIYDATVWTFENLSLGGYVVDCPHRERFGYGGDAHASTECALNNFSMGAFYTKWAQDWRDVQSDGSVPDKLMKDTLRDGVEKGNLPYTAPTYWGGGGPCWSGFCVTLPWEVYERYGDVRILEENFPMIQAWLTFLETRVNDDILRRWGGDWDFLGDWLWPGASGVNGDTRETLFFNNCSWIFNLQTAARIADVIGRKKDAALYRTRADQACRAVHNEFFIPAENSYVNGFQAYLAAALFVNLPPAHVRPAVEKRLEEEILIRRRGHIHAGITGGAFLYKALLDLDRQDLLFAMANKDTYPGWGDMLRSGATTICESWEMKYSLCHSSYLYIGTWFIEGLAGIQVDQQSPGMKRFILKPGIVDDPSLKWVNGYHDSIYGRITSNWKIDDKRMLDIKVTVPPNTTARLYLPSEEQKTVTESGQPIDMAAGVKTVGVDKGWMILELASGVYDFRCKIDNSVLN